MVVTPKRPRKVPTYLLGTYLLVPNHLRRCVYGNTVVNADKVCDLHVLKLEDETADGRHWLEAFVSTRMEREDRRRAGLCAHGSGPRLQRPRYGPLCKFPDGLLQHLSTLKEMGVCKVGTEYPSGGWYSRADVSSPEDAAAAATKAARAVVRGQPAALDGMPAVGLLDRGEGALPPEAISSWVALAGLVARDISDK